jgi:hypothetical protein
VTFENLYIVYVHDTWQTNPYCAGAFRELVWQHEEQALGLQRQAQQALRGYQQMGPGQLTVLTSVLRIRDVFPGYWIFPSRIPGLDFSIPDPYPKH